MHFSELFIRRPVFAAVVSLLMVLVGLVAWQRLAVREYPQSDEPVVTVQTDYRGASADVIEREVTRPIEEALAGISGLNVTYSASRPERSQVTARFDFETDPDVAASDVRDRVSRARGKLPDDIDEPVIAKVEADAQPIMFVAFMSDDMSALEITDYLDRTIKDRLQTQPGVAEVRIFGERRYSMRIWIDRARLAAYDLTVQDVENAIRAQNSEIPSGRIESSEREFTVLSKTALKSPEEFGDIVVKKAGGFQVRLKDVAKIEIGAADIRRSNRYNGKTAIVLGIVKQATANPLEVSKAIQAELNRMQPELPQGLASYVGYDSSIFIDESIRSVYHTIAEAIALVVLVIFFFLRTLRASLIPVITIPISLITTFAIMLALGFTVNTLTLLAMVLAIGLVVDDAIVVLENIYRHIEEGLTPFEASIKGAREITFAVIAMTITLAAVYAPVGFTTGRAGKLFLEFALTLASAVVVSGFVALTLTPMMCARLLRHNPAPGRVNRMLEGWLNALDKGYARALARAINMRFTIVTGAVLVAVACGVLYQSLPRELAPTEDRGVILVTARAPEGATIQYTEHYAKEVEASIMAVPEVAGTLVISGFPQVTNIQAFARLKPWSERDRTQQEIVEELKHSLGDIAGVKAVGINPPSLGQRNRSQPVDFVIETSASYDQLQAYVDQVMAEVNKNPGFDSPDTDLQLSKPQLDIKMNRDRVADAGLNIETVGRTLETFLGGRQVTRYERDGKQYDVIVQVADDDRRTPADISEIYVRGGDGRMVQLSNLVAVKEMVSPDTLNHFDQLRSAKITSNIASGYSVGEGLAFLEKTVKSLLPGDVRIDYDGQSREFKQASGALAVTFMLALVFIYLVLAAQFESFADPLVILVSVPLSMAGALLALKLTGNSLNIYSQVGLVTLVGLITKHGILIVEFSNQNRLAGKPLCEAVIEAASLRLRPILMTTGAMVLGALPLALASGAGAESRSAIGWVIVGGMSFGTLLTLFVVPVIYVIVAGRRERRLGRDAPREKLKLHGAE